MRIGLCANSAADIAIVAASTLDYLEENVQSHLAPEGPDAAFAERLGASAAVSKPILAANCFLPGALKCVGPQIDRPRLVRYAERAFARARSAGIDTIVFGSGGSRQRPEGCSSVTGFAQYVALLRDLGPLAQRAGVMVVVEPLNRGECNLINTLEEGAEAVRQCGHPHVRLLADLYHMMRNDEGPDAIAAHGGLLYHTHVAEPTGRTAPGIAGDDFRPYLRALRGAGYDRRMSMECGWADLATQLPRAIDALRGQLRDAGY